MAESTTIDYDPATMLKYLDPLLDGFITVPADAQPFITLDSQKRFYLNATMRKLIGIKAHDRVAMAYNPMEHTLAILTGDAAKRFTTTSYFVDKRFYMSARRFTAEFRYDIDKAPYTFLFQRAGTVDGVYMFKLAQLKLAKESPK